MDPGSTWSKPCHVLPVVEWLPRYERRWLRGDVAAGIAVTALVVPKNLGYAGIAGRAAAERALRRGRRRRSSTRSSARPGTSRPGRARRSRPSRAARCSRPALGGEEAAQLVAAIALATGLLFLLLAVFRLGWIAQLPVEGGDHRLPRRRRGRRRHRRAAEAHRHVGRGRQRVARARRRGSGRSATSHWTTVLVGAAALARDPRPAPRSRRRSRARSCSSSAACSPRALFDLGAHGVALVGDVPRGLPTPELPDLALVGDHYATIGIAAVALLLIGFSQTAGDARAFAARHRYRIDVNQESVAQGMANVGAGVFQGMPVSTSLSASSLNESAGARTPVASLVDRRARARDAARPRAAVLGPPEGRARRRDHRRGRLRDDRRRRAAPPAPGDAVRLLDRGGRDRRRALGRRPRRRRDRRRPLARAGSSTSRRGRRCRCSAASPAPQVFRDLDENPDDETFPGIAVLRLDGGLFFATAEALEDRVRELADGRRAAARSCSTSRASTSSTPRARRS